jgi:hypothetical protein
MGHVKTTFTEMVVNRVARFFLAQRAKTGKNLSIDHKNMPNGYKKYAK